MGAGEVPRTNYYIRTTKMPLYLNSISDSQPNKSFYLDKICRCNEVDPQGFGCTGIRLEGYSSGPPVPSSGKKCGLFDPVPLDICKSCRSVFYSYFRHPYQINGYLQYPRKQYCWHCLEAGVSKFKHPVYSKVPKIAPLEMLLNPYIEPPTLEETLDSALAKVSALMESLTKG